MKSFKRAFGWLAITKQNTFARYSFWGRLFVRTSQLILAALVVYLVIVKIVAYTTIYIGYSGIDTNEFHITESFSNNRSGLTTEKVLRSLRTLPKKFFVEHNAINQMQIVELPLLLIFSMILVLQCIIGRMKRSCKTTKHIEANGQNVDTCLICNNEPDRWWRNMFRRMRFYLKASLLQYVLILLICAVLYMKCFVYMKCSEGYKTINISLTFLENAKGSPFDTENMYETIRKWDQLTKTKLSIRKDVATLIKCDFMFCFLWVIIFNGQIRKERKRFGTGEA